MATKVDWGKVEEAATLLEKAGMPYLASMARKGGTAADQIEAGTLVRCETCYRSMRPGEECGECAEDAYEG